jgi:hypothetical protein
LVQPRVARLSETSAPSIDAPLLLASQITSVTFVKWNGGGAYFYGAEARKKALDAAAKEKVFSENFQPPTLHDSPAEFLDRSGFTLTSVPG